MQHAADRSTAGQENPGTAAPKVLRASDAVSVALRRLLDEKGEAAAVDLLGLSRQTVARLYGGMRVQAGTLVLAAQRLGVDLRGAIAEPETEG
jgi:hypothetical protein